MGVVVIGWPGRTQPVEASLMEKEKVIEKIRLLLKLSESPNVYEAAAAAAKAQELMFKYNLDLAQVEAVRPESAEPYIQERFSVGGSSHWLKLLMFAIARHNFCQAVD